MANLFISLAVPPGDGVGVTMTIEYGPPGHKGVTQIMGVGQDEYFDQPLEVNVNRLAWISVAAWGVAWLAGMKNAKKIAFGATISLWAVKILSSPPTS
jgi:hypothetical protein